MRKMPQIVSEIDNNSNEIHFFYFYAIFFTFLIDFVLYFIKPFNKKRIRSSIDFCDIW